MNRNKMVLAALAAWNESVFTPVQDRDFSFTPAQVQSFFFYIERKLGPVLGGPYFRFTFKDLGPCDAELDRILAELRDQGDLEVFCMPGSAVIKAYGLTPDGRLKAKAELAKIPAWIVKEIKDLCGVVQTSFASSDGAGERELPTIGDSQRA